MEEKKIRVQLRSIKARKEQFNLQFIEIKRKTLRLNEDRATVLEQTRKHGIMFGETAAVV